MYSGSGLLLEAFGSDGLARARLCPAVPAPDLAKQSDPVFERGLVCLQHPYLPFAL